MDISHELDKHLADYCRIVKGIETFVGFGFEEIRDYFETHEEDKLCELRRPDGKSFVQCTRDSMLAISSIAERHISSLPNAEDYSLSDMVEAIRSLICRAIVEEPSDEAVIERTLREATDQVQRSHIDRTFHFPCVLATRKSPSHFSIGPVSFATVSYFMEAKKEAFDSYVNASANRGSAEDWVERFKTYGTEFGWVASVPIPPCAESVSESRSERTAATAINLIRLFLGADYARDMRLAHSLSSSPANCHFAVEAGKKLDIWSTHRPQGALVDDRWVIDIQSHAPGYWSQAAHILYSAVRARQSDMASRVIESLGWFGEATFEGVPGKQIAKFEAALERLAVTGSSFKLHLFCARVALLARDGLKDDVEECYWKAFQIHVARSQVVHGILSPESPKFRESLILAHDVARTALLRGLEIHCHLDDSGAISSRKSLDDFYNKQMSPHASLFSRLRKELAVRRLPFR